MEFEDITTRQIDYVVNLAGLVKNAGPSHVKNNSSKAVDPKTLCVAQAIWNFSWSTGSAIGYYGIDDQEKWAEPNKAHHNLFLCLSFAKSGSFSRRSAKH